MNDESKGSPNSVLAYWIALVIVLPVVCIVAVAVWRAVSLAASEAADVVFSALVPILEVEYAPIAALLGPLRPARGSDLEGFIIALLLFATVAVIGWAFYKAYSPFRERRDAEDRRRGMMTARNALSNTCPRCGSATHSPGAHFCDNCGARRDGESSEVP